MYFKIYTMILKFLFNDLRYQPNLYTSPFVFRVIRNDQCKQRMLNAATLIQIKQKMRGCPVKIEQPFLCLLHNLIHIGAAVVEVSNTAECMQLAQQPQINVRNEDHLRIRGCLGFYTIGREGKITGRKYH